MSSKQVRSTEKSEQAYERLAKVVEAKMHALKLHLELHAAAQKRDPKNWGLVGDLSAVSRRLGELLGEEE